MKSAKKEKVAPKIDDKKGAPSKDKATKKGAKVKIGKK